MTEPQSVKQENWTDFPRYAYSIFTDRFVHHHFLNLKLRSESDRNSADVRIASKTDDPVEFGHEVKLLWKIYQSRAIYTKFKSNNYFKVHYDNGIIERGGIKWNLYGSVNGNRKMENINFRIGAHLIGSNFQTDNRLKFEWGHSAGNKCTFYNRSIFTSDKLILGFLGAFEMFGSHHHLLLKNNLVLGYEPNQKTSLFLRMENIQYRKDQSQLSSIKSLFDYSYLDIVSSFNNNFKYGLELAYSMKSNRFDELTTVAQYTNQKWDHIYKAKINQRMHLSLLWKFRTQLLGEKIAHSIGIHSRGLTRSTPLLYGFQIEFNA